MGKLLLFVLFSLVVYLLLKRGSRSSAGRTVRAPTAEQMVQCAYCRLHLPLSEALADDEQRYCCEEHRRLGPR